MSWQPRKSILVPTDFSAASVEALSVARDLVDDPSHIHVLHVLAPIYPAPGAVWNMISLDDRRSATLLSLDRHIEEHGLSAAQRHVRDGDPGWIITALAETLGADLIVIPSHGRTGLRRLVMGSVAERVVRHAPCPVLVLRRPLKDT